MATASEALQEKVESARKLQWELTKCQKELEAVKASILARREPDDIRRKFRACQDAMMVLGRLLMLDGRFKPRLPSDLRNEALDMLRAGARPHSPDQVRRAGRSGSFIEKDPGSEAAFRSEGADASGQPAGAAKPASAERRAHRSRGERTSDRRVQRFTGLGQSRDPAFV